MATGLEMRERIADSDLPSFPLLVCFTFPVQLIKIRCAKVLKELSHLAVFPRGGF